MVRRSVSFRTCKTLSQSGWHLVQYLLEPDQNVVTTRLTMALGRCHCLAKFTKHCHARLAQAYADRQTDT